MACDKGPPLYGEDMVTYKTLETYLAKVTKQFAFKEKEIAELRVKLDRAEKDLSAMHGQIITLQTLMNIEENPPIVEMPFASDEEIERLYEKRLDMFDGETEESFFEKRKESTYRREAEEIAAKVDEINKKCAEGAG